MIRLSIIVPFYNVEKYIEQCIRSLYDQDIPQEEYEVICVDDCSPDDSRAIVEKLQLEYSNLYLIIHDSNKKLGGARNTGLQAAQGEYVLFVDSDDMVTPNSLGNILYVAEQENVDFIEFGHSIIRGREIYPIPTVNMPLHKMSGVDMFFFPKTIWSEHHIMAWNKLYSRNFLFKNSLFFVEYMMYEDNDFAFRIFATAKKTLRVQDVVYLYRENDTSVTRTEISLVHISYWIMLSSTLRNLYNQFVSQKKDARFLEALSHLIRWNNKRIIEYSKHLSSPDMNKLQKLFRNDGVWKYCKFCGKWDFIRLLKLTYISASRYRK
ncbi:MAG: glycosyltransferase family 2 protein [Paludibacteraceae bacterium]|nr:glycosyltransferase family 2 protein [Paludibacteraceae bacterium]